jgi:hypothetical protein
VIRCRTAVLAVLAAIGLLMFPTPSNAFAEGSQLDLADLSTRTSVSYQSLIPSVRFGSENEHEARPGLSIMKLYLAEYALRHGNASEWDRSLAEQMIRFSDDHAADLIDAEYPEAIDSVSNEFGLDSTWSSGYWGTSLTSTADVAKFLAAKLTADANSPILSWMTNAGKVAADGTVQNWGTANLPGVIGTKWGWTDGSDPGLEVASASFGPGFVIVSMTFGSAQDQNADLCGALAGPQLVCSLLDA